PWMINGRQPGRTTMMCRRLLSGLSQVKSIGCAAQLCPVIIIIRPGIFLDRSTVVPVMVRICSHHKRLMAGFSRIFMNKDLHISDILTVMNDAYPCLSMMMGADMACF